MPGSKFEDIGGIPDFSGRRLIVIDFHTELPGPPSVIPDSEAKC